MKAHPRRKQGARSVAAEVRARVEEGGERLWRFEDFAGLPSDAVAQALSRLARSHALERLSKGTYYRSRQTPFGSSQPSSSAMQRLAAKQRPIFPSGLAAASILGFTTQAAARGEVATSAASLPRKLVGHATRVHTRRPPAWDGLSEEEASLLDFLRGGGTASELSPEATVRKTLMLLSESNRYLKLARVASTEPPRVRALLGALGKELGKSDKTLQPLRASLNPISRFEFGVFRRLASARSWQAKG